MEYSIKNMYFITYKKYSYYMKHKLCLEKFVFQSDLCIEKFFEF